MNIYYYFFILIFTTKFIYGQEIAVDGECKPVNKLLHKKKSNNCCLEKGITCVNGHITKIDLSSSNLTGNIPSDLGKLSKLEELYFYIN